MAMLPADDVFDDWPELKNLAPKSHEPVTAHPNGLPPGTRNEARDRAGLQRGEIHMRMVVHGLTAAALTAALVAFGPLGAAAEEDFASWPVLTSSFPSTGGGGYVIKGYDPVIKGGQCITTFMASLPPDELYFNVVEYDAVPAQGGTLCTNGQWRSFNGKDTGSTPFRMFFKDGVFRGR
jgi:hypothetical protein